ncbi:cellulose synthase-like protein H1 [Phalaenopsis equestris]|uniref:cellulose synthase-like protein H1 n=1 Tax=Phalaenopsis equestris TaxID=78828 RepID=UPI0009E32EC0|nr:cellulose synthase-like protein H1 [Phalaenopsis equestris]
MAGVATYMGTLLYRLQVVSSYCLVFHYFATYTGISRRYGRSCNVHGYVVIPPSGCVVILSCVSLLCNVYWNFTAYVDFAWSLAAMSGGRLKLVDDGRKVLVSDCRSGRESPPPLSPCSLSSLRAAPNWVCLTAFFCEAWFTFVWLLYLNAKWNPVIYKAYPHRLLSQFGLNELPAVDLFVTTADPDLEPPIITVNTVLSLLAADYPANRLACYISDDGGSPITYYSLTEASKFASRWIPFCRKYDVKIRAPFMYFSEDPNQSSLGLSLDFLRDWKAIKNDYEELKQRIENVGKSHLPPHRGDDYVEFSNIERGNHQSIVKILWENKDEIDGISHLIYVSREKRPKHLHHFKAGAMNVLTRVSALMTNAPFILNVDCDMFANNHQVILHGMCLLLGLDEEASCGYVQIPQRFYGALKDDPFGNKLEVLQKFVGEGIAGIQGPLNGGTGSFHRRKIIYGCSPSQLEGQEKTTHESFPCKELKRVFGNSEELIQSTNVIIMREAKPGLSFNTELSSKIEIAKQVAASTYEQNTSWGKEIGWMYGSMTEDILTGIRIHSLGWKSANCNPNPAGFLGLSPSGGPESLTQFKRWSTGLLEILFDRNGPLTATFTKQLQFRQCLAYLLLNT